MEKAGVTEESLDAAVEATISPASLEAGARWYPEAHAFNAEQSKISGASIEQTTACTAAMSPRNQWLQNQHATERFSAHRNDKVSDEQLGAEQGGGFATSGLKAAKLERGTVSPDEGLGGPKVRSFYNNQMFPGQTNSVTVDMYMARITNRASSIPKVQADEHVQNNPSATKFLAGSKASTGGGAGHVAIGDSIRRVAALHGVSPDTVQCASWLVLKGDIVI